MRTYNIDLYGELTRIIFQLSSNAHYYLGNAHPRALNIYLCILLIITVVGNHRPSKLCKIMHL